MEKEICEKKGEKKKENIKDGEDNEQPSAAEGGEGRNYSAARKRIGLIRYFS